MRFNKFPIYLFAGTAFFGCSDDKSSAPSTPSSTDLPSSVSNLSELDKYQCNMDVIGEKITVTDTKTVYECDGEAWFESYNQSISSSKQDDSSSSSENDEDSKNSSFSVSESSSSSQESSSSEESSSSIEHYAWSFLNENLSYGEFTDERDNQIYKTIKIQDQEWMAENLNYHNINCHEYVKGLGCFYNGYASRSYLDTLCPADWRVPTLEEWEYVIAAGDPLAEGVWRDQYDTTILTTNDNSLGLTILPGGSSISITSWNPMFEEGYDVQYLTSQIDSAWDRSNGGYKNGLRFIYATSSLTSEGKRELQVYPHLNYVHKSYLRCVKDPEGFDFIVNSKEDADSLYACGETNENKRLYVRESHTNLVCISQEANEEIVWYWQYESLLKDDEE